MFNKIFNKPASKSPVLQLIKIIAELNIRYLQIQ